VQVFYWAGHGHHRAGQAVARGPGGGESEQTVSIILELYATIIYIKVVRILTFFFFLGLLYYWWALWDPPGTVVWSIFHRYRPCNHQHCHFAALLELVKFRVRRYGAALVLTAVFQTSQIPIRPALLRLLPLSFPDFFRLYLSKIDPNQMRDSLRLVKS